MAEARFCSSCGAERAAGAFCPRCGAPYGAATGTPAPAFPAPTVAHAPPAKSHRVRNVVVGVVAVLVLVGIAASLAGGGSGGSPASSAAAAAAQGSAAPSVAASVAQPLVAPVTPASLTGSSLAAQYLAIANPAGTEMTRLGNDYTAAMKANDWPKARADMLEYSKTVHTFLTGLQAIQWPDSVSPDAKSLIAGLTKLWLTSEEIATADSELAALPYVQTFLQATNDTGSAAVVLKGDLGISS